MPLQNRVDPWGSLHAEPSRGAWLGNRGILHNDRKEIVAPWRHKNWIICELHYKDTKQEVFSPGSYSQLFFLDEATAFSSGHRPCAFCRRERFNEFKSAWCESNLDSWKVQRVSINQIDSQLHSERAVRVGGKMTTQALFQDIPVGTFIELQGNAFLFWGERLHRWSFNGYCEDIDPLTRSTLVTVLTPMSIVRAFRGGFQPQVHESACIN